MQEWLDEQPLPESGRIAQPQTPTPTTPIQSIPLSILPIVDGLDAGPVLSAKSTSSIAMSLEPLTPQSTRIKNGLLVTPESISTDLISIDHAPIQPNAKRDDVGSKRLRKVASMDDIPLPDKPAKTARIEVPSTAEPGSAYWVHGLLRSHERDASTVNAAMKARDQAKSEVERQQEIISALQTDRTELKAKNKELEEKNRGLEEQTETISFERASERLLAEDSRLGVEARCLKLEQEVKRVRKELETSRTELKEIKGRTVECSQEEIEKMRKGYQTTIKDLQTNLRDLDTQVHAGANNAARYRQNELEALDLLSKSEAENSRLLGRIDELTATREYDIIQLEDAQANHARAQVLVVDLAECKAELIALQARHEKLSSKHSRLSEKLVDAKEKIVQLQDKSNVTHDRLEEQQGLNAGLSEANTKIERLEQEVVKLRVKVANAEMAERTMADSLEHRTGELNKDLEKAYQRIDRLEKKVGRLRRREQERRDLVDAVETGGVIDLSLID